MNTYQIEIKNEIKKKYSGVCLKTVLTTFKCIANGMGNSNGCIELLKNMRECKKKIKAKNKKKKNINFVQV